MRIKLGHIQRSTSILDFILTFDSALHISNIPLTNNTMHNNFVTIRHKLHLLQPALNLISDAQLQLFTVNMMIQSVQKFVKSTGNTVNTVKIPEIP